MSAGDTKITAELTLDEWNLCLEGMGELQAKRTLHLIVRLHNVINAALAPVAPTNVPAPEQPAPAATDGEPLDGVQQ